MAHSLKIYLRNLTFTSGNMTVQVAGVFQFKNVPFRRIVLSVCILNLAFSSQGQVFCKIKRISDNSDEVDDVFVVNQGYFIITIKVHHGAVRA